MTASQLLAPTACFRDRLWISNPKLKLCTAISARYEIQHPRSICYQLLLWPPSLAKRGRNMLHHCSVSHTGFEQAGSHTQHGAGATGWQDRKTGRSAPRFRLPNKPQQGCSPHQATVRMHGTGLNLSVSHPGMV